MTGSNRGVRLVALALLGLTLVMAGSWSMEPVAANSVDYEDEVTSVPYQGRLTGTDGLPVADGAYDFSVALYGTESGGVPLWTETKSGVAVRDGYFGLLLGDVMPLGLEVAAQERWVAVSVRGPGDSSFTALEPRQKLISPQAEIEQPDCVTTADHDHCGDAWENCSGLSIFGEDDGSAMLFVENTGASEGTKAVWGYATASSGVVHGLHGQTNSSSGGASGVYGLTHSGYTYGVYGRTFSSTDFARGVYGHASATSGQTRGVAGRTDSSTDFATAVRGEATATSGQTYGIYGRDSSEAGRGVYGYAAASSGARFGVGGSVEGSGWGLYTGDDLYVGGSCTGCTLVFIARNAGPETLRLGDVVAVSGVGEVLQGHTTPVLEGRRATAKDPSVLGVVYMRGEFYAATGDNPEDLGDSVQPVEGEIAPGDYMLVVTSGLARVRVAPGVGGLVPGQSLAVAEVAGAATFAGAETAPHLVFGQAMEAQADENGLIWAMIRTR
jgi:hypothetical protein